MWMATDAATLNLALTLLVPGVFAHDADHPFAADDLALIADPLDARTDFHGGDPVNRV